MDGNDRPDPPSWVWNVGYVIGLAIVAGLGVAIIFWLFTKVGII